ncbi:MAG: acetyltransferase [Flavobacteriales bacterium]
MKKIAIIGASGFSKDIKELIDEINKVFLQWKIAGFYDDNIKKGTEIYEDLICLGSMKELMDIKENLDLVFSIENRKIVERIFMELRKKNNLCFPNLIHPKAYVSPTIELGKGNIIEAFSYISCNVEIGGFNLINSYVLLGHDVKIKNYNSFMPKTQIAGCVTMEEHNFFGMNSGVVQNVKIGSNNKVLGFTFLTKSIQDNRKYFGVPAKKMNI